MTSYTPILTLVFVTALILYLALELFMEWLKEKIENRKPKVKK